MHIDSYFSISNSDLDDAEYVIFGIPYDATQSFKPGSRFAPNAVREASWNLESYSTYFDFDLSLVKTCDAGNVNCDGSFEDIVKKVDKFTAKIDAFPIALGGEHTVSFAASQNFDNVCYVVFDAHFDLRDEFDSIKYNHACTIRRVLESGRNVVILGVRSGTREEKDFARDKGIKWLYSWEYTVEEALNLVKSHERIYLSLDMDVFDPSFAPGVSTPEPLGLNPFDFLHFVEKIAGRLVGFDICEIVPDPCKITQTLAAKLIFEVIAARAAREKNK